MRLPDFLIVGAQKAGTTAARHNLARHPDVAFNTRGPDHGELHFFDREDHWRRGVAWYASHFDDSAPLLGEKTPNYLSANCAARMASVLPHARLIVLLREPASRAYSQWNHFNQQPEVAGRDWRVRAFEHAIERYPTLLGFGLYARQLRALRACFPAEQIQVTIQERLLRDLDAGYRRMFDFLGLPPAPDGPRPVHRHSRPVRQPMAAATWSRLQAHFAPHNAALREMLDDPIAEWP